MKNTARTTKARANRMAAPHCSACRFWIRHLGATSKLGDCDGAMEHARSVVAFAVNITKSATFAHGGRDCPRFQPNIPICVQTNMKGQL
jgi:hypothetical protein